METTIQYRSNFVIKALQPFISQKTSVLDIGCGNGIISSNIQDHFKCALTGTDILNYLKRNISFVQMPNQTTYPFDNKKFDVGLFIDVLHHMPYEQQIIAIKGALKICSKLLIIEVAPSLITKIWDTFANYIHNREMSVCLTYKTEKMWIDYFESNNCTCTTHKMPTPVLFPFTYFLLELT